MRYDLFCVQEIDFKGGVKFNVSYLELRDDPTVGMYDVAYSQEDWRFNNDKIFQLAERLKEFMQIPEGAYVALKKVKFEVSRLPDNEGADDGYRIINNIESISFKYDQSEKLSVQSVATSKIAISRFDGVSDVLLTLIEEIFLNMYQFCIEGEIFPPDQSSAERTGDSVTFNQK